MTRGASTTLVVTFAPVEPGHFEGTLTLGAHSVSLRGDALAVPQCETSDPCREVTFDAAVGQCVERTRPDGDPCATSCLSGTCMAGQCVGTPIACDDHDACTVDACSATGECVHPAVVCPASTNPCEVPRCDGASGCVVDSVDDGVLCGPDDCTSLSVDVCLQGRCVQRPRPDSGRCTNRWVALNIPQRGGHGLAYDERRKRVVVFGGGNVSGRLDDTWEWDGTHWEQRHPDTSPPPDSAATMTYDARRSRVVLFTSGGETWEWDGTNWLRRIASRTPSPRVGATLAYDRVRSRSVLFGGFGGSPATQYAETWEWDGVTWIPHLYSTSPSPRSSAAFAYDETRRQLLLFGGVSGGMLDDTWTLDASGWHVVSSGQGPGPRAHATLAADPIRGTMILLGGGSTTGSSPSGMWEWNGATWTRLAPPWIPEADGWAASASDLDRDRIVLFGGTGAGTSEWDGQQWIDTDPRPHIGGCAQLVFDEARSRAVLVCAAGLHSEVWEYDRSWQFRGPVEPLRALETPQVAYDSDRKRVVLVAAGAFGMETWEWDGTTWREAQVVSPPFRFLFPMAYDPRRHRTVLFGGYGSGSTTTGDTWEWDGSSWRSMASSHVPPPRAGARLHYDADLQRIVLTGGFSEVNRHNDRWQWDGTDWTASGVTPRARSDHAITFDPVRHRTMLFGGWDGSRDLGDTMEGSGILWTPLQPVAAPPPGRGSLVFDTRRQRVVLDDSSHNLWVWLPE